MNQRQALAHLIPLLTETLTKRGDEDLPAAVLVDQLNVLLIV